MSPDLSPLLQRFIDDRDGLEEHEYAQLVEAVRTSPELVAQLRDQLLMDDLLSQRLALDRLQFDAQVQQRIADHLRGEEELNQQADELRELALARLSQASPHARFSWSAVAPWGIALSLVLLIGGSVLWWQQQRAQSLLARIEAVQGSVIVRRVPNDNDVYAVSDTPLRLGDRLIVDADASLTLTWRDGTQVQLAGGSVVDLTPTTSGKRLFVDHGDLAASVAKQPAGQAMVFATPHADAIVRGTELYLHVADDSTQLEVAEGSVELVEHQTQDAQLVATAESATASTGEKVAKNVVQFPSTQRGLDYLLNRGKTLVRSGPVLHPTELTIEGNAQLSAEGLELRGGYATDRAAAGAVVDRANRSETVAFECVFTPQATVDDPRVVFSLATERALSLALVQRGNELFLVANTTRSTLAADMATAVHLATLPGSDLPAHLRVSIALRSGVVTSQVGDAHITGRLPSLLPLSAERLELGDADPRADHRWRGRISGLAIYHHGLD